jgi:hypothetical protein
LAMGVKKKPSESTQGLQGQDAREDTSWAIGPNL